MVFLCKRCGRVLKSAKSIKLGYGPTCYRISKFQDNPVNIREEIKFLKIEIKMLKKTFRELKVNEFASYQTPPIEKIKKQERSPKRDTNKVQMTEVIQELKSRFQNCNGDVKSLLKPIQIESNLIKTSQLAIV
ncbi:MAG: DUF6011 domain-containing protein [Promethearchaeota archaeon]|jgi:hypothetical protein